MNKQLKFIGTATGIFICFFYYGILQEAITKGKYTTEDGQQEPFVYTLSLVCSQCIVNYIYAVILLNSLQPIKSTDAEVKTSLYAGCSLTYLLAMVASNLSLQWLPYPTQVIGKSCKPIPVMLLGVLLGGRSYSLRKYLFILTIVLGVGLFMYNPGKAVKSDTGSFGVGEMLLVMSLMMDGLTGAVQERMRSGGGKPNSANMMKMMNIFSVGYTLIGLLMTGEAFTFIGFLSRHPATIGKIITFSLATALGQFFIYVMVSEWGPLPCSIVTTTRKFFTILASVLLFGNVLTSPQWIGAGLVFVGLGLDSVYK